jgi:hypothetical protein
VSSIDLYDGELGVVTRNRYVRRLILIQATAIRVAP